jgi:hypothetical protein
MGDDAVVSKAKVNIGCPCNSFTISAPVAVDNAGLYAVKTYVEHDVKKDFPSQFQYSFKVPIIAMTSS